MKGNKSNNNDPERKLIAEELRIDINEECQ